MNLKDTYNKIAEDWHNEVLDHRWWEESMKTFISFLHKGDLVFDVGCGPGITAEYFINHGFKVFGIDFSLKMIEIAKRKVPQGKFLVMDLNEVNKLDDAFDAIYMKAVLLHIPKKEAKEILKNIAGLLKRRGYIYIAVKEKWSDGPNEDIKIDNDYGYTVKRFFSYFTEDKVKTYLRDLNFEIVFFEIISYKNTKWIQVIGKKIN